MRFVTNASVVIIIMHLGDECSFVEIRQQQSEINALPTFFGLLISSTYLVSIASRHHQNMWVPRSQQQQQHTAAGSAEVLEFQKKALPSAAAREENQQQKLR